MPPGGNALMTREALAVIDESARITLRIDYFRLTFENRLFFYLTCLTADRRGG